MPIYQNLKWFFFQKIIIIEYRVFYNDRVLKRIFSMNRVFHFETIMNKKYPNTFVLIVLILCGI